MQPFEIVDASHVATHPPNKSCLHRPGAEFVHSMTSSTLNKSAASHGGGGVAAGGTGPAERRVTNNSPTRSPQRAASPSRAVVPVPTALSAPQHAAPTTQTCNKPVARGVGRLLQPLASNAAVEGGDIHRNSGSRYEVEMGEYVSLSESNDAAGGVAAGAILQRSESLVSDADPATVSSCEEAHAAGVVALEYLVVCDDVKRIAQEREETFPRCDHVPSVARLPAAVLERLAPLDEQQRTRTHPAKRTECLVSAQLGHVMVSQCFPSAPRCVIPDDALQRLIEEQFLPLACSDDVDDDTPTCIWISATAELVVDIGRLRTPLRQLSSGAAQPVHLHVPFFVEDVSNIVPSSSSNGAPYQPLRSPLYVVEVHIGEQRDLKPHAQKPHAAKKLHTALQHSHHTSTAANNTNNNHTGPIKPKGGAAAAAAGLDVGGISDDTLTALNTLPSLPVHSFRPLPEMITCAHIGYWLLLTQPMTTLRSTTEVSERTMLRKGLFVVTDADPTPARRGGRQRQETCLSAAEATAAVTRLMSQLESALALQSPIASAVQPVLHQLVPLLTNIGGRVALEKAMSLARLRVQLQCRVIGISEAAIVEPAESMPIQALTGVLDATSPAGGRRSDDAISPTSTLKFVASLLCDNVSASEALLQYVVECAHLMKHCGRFTDARLWYKVGMVLSSLLRSSMTAHNRGAQVASSSGSSMVRGDETASLPFLQAIGDVCVHIGRLDDAIAAYEIGRALAEMDARLAPAPAGGGGALMPGGGAAASSAFFQPKLVRVLEFDASIAVAAAMAHRHHTAQTAFLRCSKALEDAHLLQVLLQRSPLAATAGGSPEVCRAIAAIEAAVDVLCHLVYCCIARDSHQQAAKLLEDAALLLDAAHARTSDGGGAAPQQEDERDALWILRGNLDVLSGWSALRSAMLRSPTTDGPQQTPPSPSAESAPSRRRVTLPSDDGSEVADQQEQQGGNGSPSTSLLLERATLSFDSAAAHYQRGGAVDARLLTATSQWLGLVCCSEHLGACDALDAAVHAVSVPQHPIDLCLSATSVYLHAAELKQNQLFLDATAFSSQRTVQVTEALQKMSSNVASASAPDRKPLVDNHPLTFFLWEMAAVSCALVEETDDACMYLDMAAATFIANHTEDGERLMATPSSTSPQRAAFVSEASEGCMSTFLRRDAHLLCSRLAPLSAYCFTLAEHKGHRRCNSVLSTMDSKPVALTPVARAERMVLELIHHLGLDNVQANQRSTTGDHRSPPGHRSHGVTVGATMPVNDIPSIFLDAAELRMCQEDYLSCLEGCGRAVRLADERNLLYLLGPLFQPSFQLSPSDVEDRARLLRDRRVEATTNGTMLGLALFTMARCHERSGNFKQALAIYAQCFASAEMMRTLQQPVATEALVGCARASLHLGVIGDGQMYADVADELFETFHGQFGAYRGVAQLVDLRNSIDHCRRTADRLAVERHYRLAAHEELYASPSLNGFPLYL